MGRSHFQTLLALALFCLAAVADAQPAPGTNNPPAQPAAPSVATPVPADVEKAMALPDAAARRAALAAAVTAWTQSQPIDAMQWAVKIQDKALQRMALETAGSVWLQNDEKAALAWAMNHGGGLQQHFIFGGYGARHGQAAADWTLAQPQHNAGELGVVVEAWCGHPADPKAVAAASAWALQQKLSPADVSAVLYFIAGARAWANPPDAAAWVTGLPATLPRDAAAQVVVNIWSRKIPADLPKIRAWIDQSPFPADTKAKIAKSLVVK
jgi:hypothetical protein